MKSHPIIRNTYSDSDWVYWNHNLTLIGDRIHSRSVEMSLENDIPTKVIANILGELMASKMDDSKSIRVRAAREEFYKHKSGAMISIEIDKEIDHKKYRFQVYGHNPQAAKGVMHDIISGFQKFVVEVPDDSVQFKFWFMSGNGPTSFTRNLKCPTWDEIKSNYPKAVISGSRNLEWIHKVPNITDMGKVILWTGVPGTGKTYAVRSLGKAWEDRWNICIINDIEIFLQDTAYMMQVVSEAAEDICDEEEHSVNKGTLLIFEDAAKYVFQNARHESNASMGRMLNLTDGILGQGLNLAILITTNEEIKEVDSAFLRPGRLVQEIEFTKLTYKESVEWMKDNGGDPDKLKRDTEYTIAELYSEKYDNESNYEPPSLSKKKHNVMGFR